MQNVKNEPILDYAPNSSERAQLEAALKDLASSKIQIPCIINGKEIYTGKTVPVVMPHSHGEVLADLHLAGPAEIQEAISGALRAKQEWANTGWEKRLQIFERIADLLAGEWRMKINGATMLGQSKNVFQAEIDAACEFVDFFRINAAYYREILRRQPFSADGMQNTMDYRALDGFVAAITPFNFTAIAANLPGAPAMAGNVCVWKPSETQAFSAYFSMKLFQAAGLPDGVIQFVPAEAANFGEIVLKSPDLGAVHFTGSTRVFEHIYQTIGANVSKYKCFPRMVGETGGKDFVFAHMSADVDALRVALVRGAYEFQGQKCSAASRAYIPESVWEKLRDPLLSEISAIKMGDTRDFSCLMNAVIDRRAFDKIKSYQDLGKTGSEYKLLAGGGADSSKGFFVQPTLFQTTNPSSRLMMEEIFGPVLTLYVFPDRDMEQVLDVCANSSMYALTGAILAQDENVIADWSLKLRDAAGNFYINDKPTGAVVGQQPFGGARRSGTNDKSGSEYNLIRWISPRTIKRNLNPPKSVGYPFMR